MASVGKHIKHLRTSKHMTPEQLAERLFVTRQAVSAWETEKALPDVDTLERIASTLDTEVTEVIYGMSQTRDLKRIKHRWAMIGSIAAIILAIIYIILHNYGFIGTWRYGLRYQFWNQNYAVTLEELPSAYSLELDLTDLDSNVGKALYEDDSGCRITVQSLEEATSSLSGYALTFQAKGICTQSGGQLVSGCYDKRIDKQSYSLERSAAMRTTIHGIQLPHSHYSVMSCLKDSGNFFGFHVFPPEAYHGDLLPEDWENTSTVTITVTSLIRLTTQCLPYLSPFS